MPIYRVTFGFEGLGVGWSETHAAKSNQTSASNLIPAATAVAQKRVTFLGREFAINAIRVSKYSDDTGTTRQRGVFLLRQRFVNPVGTAAQAAEPAAVALLGVGGTAAAIAPPGFADNQNRTFLGAPPDDAVNNGGIVDPGKANLRANFDQWVATLIGGNTPFGWLGSARANDFDISSATQNTDGTVTFSVHNATGPVAPVIGTQYPARVRRINGGNSPLNGPLIVTCINATTFTTTEVIGIALAQVGGKLRLYLPISPFVQYATLDLQLEVAKHQRGRPFGHSPGRARKRIRG